MKQRTFFIALLLTAIMVLTLVPIAAMAAPLLDVEAWADPMYVQDGAQIDIHIRIMNNTGEDIWLTGYRVGGDHVDMVQLWEELKDGAETKIIYPYTVSLGPNDSMSEPVLVTYDDGTGAPQRVFAKDQVEIFREQVNTTVDFSFTPDASVIDPGGWINYTIDCENTGNVTYLDFTVTANGTDVEKFDLAVGEQRTVMFSETYFQDTMQEFGYYFDYMDNGARLSVVQNPVSGMNVTVNSGPVQTQQPIPTPVTTPAATPSSAVSPSASSVAPSGTQQAAPGSASSQAAQPADDSANNSAEWTTDEQDVQLVGSAQISTAKQGLSTVVIVLIAVVVLLIAVVIVLIVVLSKRKKRGISPPKRDGNAL